MIPLDAFALGGRQDDPIPAMVDAWFQAWDVCAWNDEWDEAEAITGAIQAELFDAVPSSLAGISAQLRFLRRCIDDSGEELYTDNRVVRLIDAMIAGAERMTGMEYIK